MAIYDRVCRECGCTFSGGPRAWYCPDCRSERQRRREKEYKHHPSKRPLSSEDVCQNCGKKYIVNCGLQKCCPDCKERMHKELDNRQGKAYYRARYDTKDAREVRSLKRRAKYAENKDEINRKRREKNKRKKADED